MYLFFSCFKNKSDDNVMDSSKTNNLEDIFEPKEERLSAQRYPRYLTITSGHRMF